MNAEKIYIVTMDRPNDGANRDVPLFYHKTRGKAESRACLLQAAHEPDDGVTYYVRECILSE